MNRHPANQRQSAIADLQVALQAIPHTEKVEWLQVLRVAPHLVDTESDPMAFLRYCNWDVTAAARRLTVYWRQRVEVFGETRAFLPLLNDWSGNGALGRDEIEVIRSGGSCIMPKDVHNRSVLYRDTTNVPVKFRERTDVRIRSAFYNFQEMALNPLSQTSGAVIVIRGMPGADNTIIARKTAELFREAFPLRLCAIHLVYFRGSGNGYLQSLAPFLLTQFGQLLNKKLFVHNCDSVEEAVQKLARHGVPRTSLPPCLGGFAVSSAVLQATSALEQQNAGCVTSEQKPLSNDDTATSVHNPFIGVNPDFSLLQTRAAAEGAPGPGIVPVAALGAEQQPMLLDSTRLVELPQTQHHAGGGAPELSLPDGADPGGNDFFGILDMNMSTLDTAGSPFDPRPIMSEPAGQHQQQAFGTNDDAVLAVDNVLPGESMHTTGVVLEPSPQDPVQVRSPPMEARQVAAHPTSRANPTIEEAPVHRDDNPLVETPEIVQKGLAALDEAMAHLHDVDQSAYKKAIQIAPQVVKADSDPLAYLRFSKFDAWAAAKRLATYWTYRVKYFGDAAFRPLTQTTGGALGEEDLRTLKAGTLFFLPNDSRGRPVLCFDLAKCPDDASAASRIRVAMYFFTILCCEYPIAMTEGFVMLVFVSIRINELSRFDQNIREVTDIALDSFPTQTCETHVIYSPPPTSTSSPERSFTALVLPVLLRTVGRFLTHERAHLHVGYTRDELESRLTSSGLSGLCLEAAMNGGISDEDFAAWMQNRQVLELQRCAQASQQQQWQPQPSSPETRGKKRTADGETKVPAIATSSEPQDIDSAMASVLGAEKKAYMEALKEAPDLVKKESNPDRFMKLENNDPLAAARRLAAYWRIRREIFGERAFLPMDQTGDGALDRKDVIRLQTSFLIQLPNDSGGRSVICCDGSRLEKASSPWSTHRIFFYLWHVVSQNSLAQTEGYSVLYNMADPSFDRACRNCLELVMEAQPVRLKSFHLLGCCADGTSESDFRRQGIVRDMTKLLEPFVLENVEVHVCESRRGFANKLGAYGMTKDGLPKTLGGKLGVDDFVKWQELRVRYEWDLPIKTSLHEVAERYSIPASTAAAPPFSSLSEEGKVERQRRLNVIHSRRQRERVRIEVQMLQEQVGALREERKELIREGRKLEGLLQRAQAIADEC